MKKYGWQIRYQADISGKYNKIVTFSVTPPKHSWTAVLNRDHLYCHMDIHILHTSSNTTPGNFVSTTANQEIANQFAKRNGYVYVIDTNNYIDINKTYGNMANYPEQMEFSIPGYGLRQIYDTYY